MKECKPMKRVEITKLIYWREMDRCLGSLSAKSVERSLRFLFVAQNRRTHTHHHGARGVSCACALAFASEACHHFKMISHTPIGQRKWEFIPKSDKVIGSRYQGSKKDDEIIEPSPLTA